MKREGWVWGVRGGGVKKVRIEGLSWRFRCTRLDLLGLWMGDHLVSNGRLYDGPFWFFTFKHGLENLGI